MKKILLIVILSATFFLPGCVLAKTGNPASEAETMQNLGIAYKAGSYTIIDVYCSGYITSGQTSVRLAIVTPKRFIEGQTVKATAVKDVSIRTVDGSYVYEQKADLTQFINEVII